MAAKQIWVTRNANGWCVRRGKSATIDTARTQREALDLARPIARRERAELIWQGRDGRIVGRSSYGNDPRRSPG